MLVSHRMGPQERLSRETIVLHWKLALPLDTATFLGEVVLHSVSSGNVPVLPTQNRGTSGDAVQ